MRRIVKPAEQFPRPSRVKRINVEEFVKLAKKVRKSFQEQKEYLEQEEQRFIDTNNSSFFQFS